MHCLSKGGGLASEEYPHQNFVISNYKDPTLRAKVYNAMCSVCIKKLEQCNINCSFLDMILNGKALNIFQ